MAKIRESEHKPHDYTVKNCNFMLQITYGRNENGKMSQLPMRDIMKRKRVKSPIYKRNDIIY